LIEWLFLLSMEGGIQVKFKVAVLILSLVIVICAVVTHASFQIIDGKKYFNKDGRLIPIPQNVKEDIKLNGKAYNLNFEVFKSKGYIVYGSAADIENNDIKIDSNKITQYRYLGFDVNGNNYANVEFPEDVNLGLMPWEKNWIYAPWSSSAGYKCKQSIVNRFYPEKTKKYLELISHKGQYWAGKNGWTASKLVNYLNIQSPPTDISPGTAIGWHKENGNTYYEIFMLIPKLVDYQADTLKTPKTAVIGSSVSVSTLSKCFAINGNLISGTTRAAWFIDNTIKNNNNAYQINGTKTSSMSFKMPNHDIKVRFDLNYSHDTPDNECGFGFDNNYVEAVIKAVTPTPTPTHKSTPTPTRKPTPTSTATPKPTPNSHSANIVAQAALYYVSDPGVDSIKSGYGFRLEVDTDIVVSPRSDKDDPKPTGATWATAYFLGKACPMEIKSAYGTSASFYLPINKSSVANARKIYIPANTVDGTYDIAIEIGGATYNGKSISKTIHKKIVVKGNMYEDDYTAPKN